MIFRDARRYEIISKDPTEFARLPKPPDSIGEKLPVFLDRAQLTEFLEAAKSSRPEDVYTMILLLSYTGLRIGEAMALTWPDVDFAAGQITVNKTLFQHGPQYKLTTPKTRRSNRVLDVPEIVLTALRNHKRTQAGQRLAAGKLWTGNFVFTAPTKPGKPSCKSYWSDNIKAVLKLCPDLPPVHPHSFRHTHASLLAEAGVSLEEIVDRLGHSTAGVTRKIYLHVTKGRKKEVAEKFARFMER